jgi:hypothetical protein
MNLRANSIGRRAAETLQTGISGRVLASFRSTSNLVTIDGAVVTLAQSGSERGPMTLLLEPNAAGHLSVLFRCDASFDVGLREVRFSGTDKGQAIVDFADAEIWEPRLPWETLRLQREHIRESAEIVAHTATAGSETRAGPLWESRLSRAEINVLEAHRRRDVDALRIALMILCGLGEGLTPQGDDWVAGWVLGLRLADPVSVQGLACESLGALVLDVAAGRTTHLSQAYLSCAAAGEAGESWHVLLRQMAQFPTEQAKIENAAKTILSHGATSGLAMLEGFLAGLGAFPPTVFSPI